MEQADKKKPDPPIIRTRQSEVEELFAFFAVLQEFEKAESDMKQRLKAIPNGLRDLRMVKAVLQKLIDRLLATFPSEKLLSLRRTLPHMSYKVYFNRSVVSRDEKDTAIVSIEDLNAVVREAHGFRCLFCDDNCNRCELGKALDHMLVRHRGKDESWSLLEIEGDDYPESLQSNT